MFVCDGRDCDEPIGSLPGVSLIKIYFHPEYNVDAGLAEITSLTYSALRFMPKGMFPPTIIKFGATNLPIANLVLSSPSLGEKEVRDIAYFTVRPQLGTVQGVSLPPTFGGTIRQITIFLDREKMLARGVSIDQVVKAVNSDWFSVILDVGSVRQGDPYEEIEKLLPYACTWQIKEAVYFNGKSTPIDLARIRKIIDKVGFRGFVPFEALGRGKPEEVTAFLERVRKAMA